MQRLIRWLLPNSILLLAVSIWPASAGVLENGRASELTALVRQDCGSCHGMTLRGGLGAPLLPSTLEHLDVEGVADIILDGVPGTPMPPWRGLLTRQEALWIARNLKQGFPK